VPISDVLRHRRGHHLAGSRTDGKLTCATLAGHASCSPVRPRQPSCRALRFDRAAIGTPSIVSRSARLFTWRTSSACFLWLGSVAPPAHRSHLETAAGCVSTSCGVFLGQLRSVGSPCSSPPLRRAMRRTDFCHLTTSYRYPCLVSFRRVRRFRACATGEIACCTAEQLASVGRTIPSCVTVVGVVFPPRCVRTEPLTPLSPPPRGPRRSRVHESSRGPPRSPSDRSRERDGHRDDPRCLPSSEDLCPATPFRAPGSGLFQLRGLATAMLASDAFESLGAPCGEPGGPGPRPRVPLPTGRHASLDLGVVRRLLQP